MHLLKEFSVELVSIVCNDVLRDSVREFLMVDD